jgi:hypothetical protein
MSAKAASCTGLPDGRYILEGFEMTHVGIAIWNTYFTLIWYILWSFGTS